MKFGICTSIDSADVVKAAGWDYLEPPAAELLCAHLVASLPIRACNLLVPRELKITGPEVDLAKLLAYLSDIIDAAANAKVKVLVFGSGGARNVRDGFDRNKAREQIIVFGRAIAPMAARKNISIALEPLNRNECNIINTISEAADYVRAVDHPNFRLLLDTYHFWIENDSVHDVTDALPLIGHVHVAEKVGRVPPGEGGGSDYRPLFRILKEGGYDSTISVEADFPDDLIRQRGRKILEYLKQEWQES